MFEKIVPQEQTTTRSLTRNETLFVQGDAASAVYEVISGSVQLQRHTLGGRAVAIYTANTGQSLAEAALFSPHYHCSAVAKAPSKVRRYPKAKVLALMRDDPAIMEGLANSFARHVQALRFQIEIRNTRSAEERVLLYIEGNCDAKSRKLNLGGPVQDLAPALGITREALYRALAALTRRGAIERTRDSLLLL